MSVQNFIPQVHGAGVLRERDRVMVAARHCSTEYVGKIRQLGDRVKLVNVGAVTSHAYTRGTDIPAAQAPVDAALWLDINQADVTHVTLDDVDDAQAQENLMAEYRRQQGLSMAGAVDRFIFNLHPEAGHTITQASLTSANVISTLQFAVEWFLRQDVPDGETKYLEITPEVLSKLALSKIVRDTDNSKAIEQGYRGNFLGLDVYVSNNIARTAGVHHCIARTKSAIGFASQLTKVELYRPDPRFADNVKTLQVYGGKVVRPKELVRLNLTPVAETAI